MKILLKTESYKLFRSRSLWVLIFFSLALLVLLRKQSGVSVMDIQFWAEWNFLQMASVLAAFYGIVIAHEYISGYFMEAICRGYRRWEIYFARYLIFLLGTIFIILLPCLLCFLFSFLHKEAGLVSFMSSGRDFFVGFSFTVLYCVCLSSFFMMLTIITKTYSMVIFTCIFYNMAIVIIHEIIPAGALPWWVEYSFLGIRQNLFFQTMEAKKGISVFVSLIVQSVLYTVAGGYCFSKKELR